MTPHQIEVRYTDLDTMGHVNNAVFLVYFEQGRMSFFRQRITDSWDWINYGIIVARNEIDYLTPVLLQDEVYVTAEFGSFGNKSFQMMMDVYKLEAGQRVDCARGLVTVVCFDYKQKKTISVPDAWRKEATK